MVNNKYLKGVIFDSAISMLSYDGSYLFKLQNNLKGDFFFDELNIIGAKNISSKLDLYRGKSLKTPVYISKDTIRVISDGLRGIITRLT